MNSAVPGEWTALIESFARKPEHSGESILMELQFEHAFFASPPSWLSWFRVRASVPFHIARATPASRRPNGYKNSLRR
jgi:hypothetical protein